MDNMNMEPMNEEQQLTPMQEEKLLNELIAEVPKGDEKHNVHTFLHQVSTSNDTTKTGNLSDEELGFTKFSERTYKTLELASYDLCNDDIWGDYFKKKAEILTSTSLAKAGFLTSLAVIQRRQIEDVTKPRVMTENKGWFKKKEKDLGIQQ